MPGVLHILCLGCYFSQTFAVLLLVNLNLLMVTNGKIKVLKTPDLNKETSLSKLNRTWLAKA